MISPFARLVRERITKKTKLSREMKASDEVNFKISVLWGMVSWKIVCVLTKF